MSRKRAELEELTEEITVDANGDGEVLRAFRQAFEDDVDLPSDGFVIGEPIEEWARPIIARGPRPAFEMEQVLPGEDPDDPFDDPITKSNDLKDAGDFAFDTRPEEAIRHYEVGLRIGELSLGDDFEGVLPWGHIDSRPFLRCMHGFGLCLWRLGRFEEAERVFDRMLWLNPSDNRGVRSVIGEVKAREAWKEDRQER